MRLLAPSLAALVAIVPAAPARAQDRETVKAQLGEWLVVPDDGKPGCRVRLSDGKAGAGWAATPAAECKATLPKLADVRSWNFDGGVSLFDGARKPVLVFGEDETTLLKTRGDAVPNYLMVQAKPGVDRAPHASAIVGSWAMQRPNGPAICRVTFADKPPPGAEESFALSLDPACDPAVKRLKLGSWRVEDFALMLYGTGDSSLRFEPASGGGFEKAKEEKGRPLLLVRAKP